MRPRYVLLMSLVMLPVLLGPASAATVGGGQAWTAQDESRLQRTLAGFLAAVDCQDRDRVTRDIQALDTETEALWRRARSAQHAALGTSESTALRVAMLERENANRALLQAQFAALEATVETTEARRRVQRVMLLLTAVVWESEASCAEVARAHEARAEHAEHWPFQYDNPEQRSVLLIDTVSASQDCFDPVHGLPCHVVCGEYARWEGDAVTHLEDHEAGHR